MRYLMRFVQCVEKNWHGKVQRNFFFAFQ